MKFRIGLFVIFATFDIWAMKLDTTVICKKETKTCVTYWSFNSGKISSYWKKRIWHSMGMGQEVLKKTEFNKQISLISEIERKAKDSTSCTPNLVISRSLNAPSEVCDKLLTKSQLTDLGKILN